jgi:phospholipid transport system substrate-binding protein
MIAFSIRAATAFGGKNLRGVITVRPFLSRRYALVPLFALGLLMPAVAGRADTAPDARQFITKLVNTALQTLADTTTDESKREHDFSHLLRDNFDIPRIARFVLGRYWTSASDQDRRHFVEIYREFIIRSYAAQFAQYRGETVKVTNSRPEGSDITVVNSEIIHPSGDPPIRVAWRVHRNGNDYKIVDVDVEGISMLLAQREEFTSVIQRSSGSLSGLIQQIERKLQAGEAGGKS